MESKRPIVIGKPANLDSWRPCSPASLRHRPISDHCGAAVHPERIGSDWIRNEGSARFRRLYSIWRSGLSRSKEPEMITSRSKCRRANNSSTRLWCKYVGAPKSPITVADIQTATCRAIARLDDSFFSSEISSSYEARKGLPVCYGER